MKYWTYKNDSDELQDLERKTAQEVIDFVEEILFEECEANGEKVGEMDITLVEFIYDEGDEVFILNEEPYTVTYEYEGSMREQHGTLR